MTDRELEALWHRSINDNLSRMIVGSEVRQVISEVRRLKAENEDLRQAVIDEQESSRACVACLRNQQTYEKMKAENELLRAALMKIDEETQIDDVAFACAVARAALEEKV